MCRTGLSLFTKGVLAALFAVVPVAGAAAADPITLPISESAAEVPVHDQGFDWNGFYAGVYGAGQFSPVGGSQYGAGFALGVNARFDFVLVGAEVAVHGLLGEMATGQVLAKGGVLATDDILIYAAVGFAGDLGAPGERDVLLGGGVEVAVADNVSLRAQYLHGFPLTGDTASEQVSLGANFHF